MNTDKTPAWLLQAEDIHGGYDGREVLHGLSLTVRPHEKLCILGPNGCGKTTLLRALAGMLPLTAGRVRLQCDGGPLDVHRARRTTVARHLALLAQHPGAATGYTVWETVLLGRWAHRKGLLGTPDAADRTVAEDCLRRTGLWALRDRPLQSLSGGQLQRVYLARTFAQQPAVILLDEPTNHLDLQYQLELTAYLTDWAAEGPRCVVGVLHDINLALDFADTLLVMREGRELAAGDAAGFDLRVLNEIYHLDVGAYMRRALGRWQGAEDTAAGGADAGRPDLDR